LQFPFRKTVEDGVPYYTFDSRIDVARFNGRNELEYIGTDPAQLVYDNGGGPSFLPFNTAGTDLFNLNLCFGMKIEIPFYMTASGTIDGKDIVFDKLIPVLQKDFHVRYNSNLQLITIRYYTQDIVNSIVANREIFLEQHSRLTAQVLVSME
jgi:hypothetical protein